MSSIPPAQITDPIRAFFKLDSVPGKLRFQAILKADISGLVWVNDPQVPQWGIIQETAYGTLHLEGPVPAEALAGLIDERRQFGDVLFGFWEDQPPAGYSFPEPPYVGEVWESDQRSTQVDLKALMEPVPEGCVIRPLDADWFARIQDYRFYSDMFGSPERALERGFGFCLTRGEAVLCEAFGGTSAEGVIEMGVNTWEGQRQQGYATLTSAYVIYEAERRGLRTYWNCAAQNLPSVRLAHKLGYAPMRKYRLYGW